MALDSSAVPYVSYYLAGAGSALQFLSCSDSTCGTVSGPVTLSTTGVNIGQYSQIGLDGTNTLRIAFYDPSGAANVGTRMTMAIDASNNVHVAYRDSQHNALVYGRRVSGVWELSVVDNAHNAARGNGIALSANGTPSMVLDGLNRVRASSSDGANLLYYAQ